MRVHFLHPILAAAALTFSSIALGADPAAELIRKGDVHYDRLQPAEALRFYLPAEKLDPDNARLLVRIARQYRHLMSDAAKSDEKLRLGNAAVAYSERAVVVAPNDPEAQLALAISYGKVLPFLSSKDQVARSPLIKTAADKVIALDPRNDLGWQMLGRWYFNVAEVGAVKRALARLAYGKLPMATYEQAEACFVKAIQLNPRRLMHYIELGRTYAKLGRDADARAVIEKGLALPDTEKDDEETKARGREILKGLK